MLHPELFDNIAPADYNEQTTPYLTNEARLFEIVRCFENFGLAGNQQSAVVRDCLTEETLTFSSEDLASMRRVIPEK